jgi:hypothetical protein
MREEAVRRITGWKFGNEGGVVGRVEVGVTQIGRRGFESFLRRAVRSRLSVYRVSGQSSSLLRRMSGGLGF